MCLICVLVIYLLFFEVDISDCCMTNFHNMSRLFLIDSDYSRSLYKFIFPCIVIIYFTINSIDI